MTGWKIGKDTEKDENSINGHNYVQFNEHDSNSMTKPDDYG